MMKLLGIQAILLLFATSLVQAQTSPKTFWNHNGSVVYLVNNGTERAFYYQDPRAGIAEQGVRADTLLFKGTARGTTYQGTAFLFRRGCGSFPYLVSGSIYDNYERVVMEGRAPRVGINCSVTGYMNDRLEFTLIKPSQSSEPGPPPVAAAPVDRGPPASSERSYRPQTQAAKDCEKLSGDAAIAACDKAIRENPRYANAYRNRGLAWEQKGNLHNALADADRAVQLNPSFTDAKNDVERYRDKLKTASPSVAAAPVDRGPPASSERSYRPKNVREVIVSGKVIGCEEDLGNHATGFMKDCAEFDKKAAQAAQDHHMCSSQVVDKLGGLKIKTCNSQKQSFGGTTRSDCSCSVDIASLNSNLCQNVGHTYNRMVKFDKSLSLPKFEESIVLLNRLASSISKANITFRASSGTVSDLMFAQWKESDPPFREWIALAKTLQAEIPNFCSLGRVSESSFHAAAEDWTAGFQIRFAHQISAKQKEMAELKKVCIPIILQGRNALGIARDTFTRPEAERICHCVGEQGAAEVFIKLAKNQTEPAQPMEAVIIQQVTGACILALNLESVAKGLPK